MKPDIKDEWIEVSKDIERFDDQDLLGYQTYILNMKSSKLKSAMVNLGKRHNFG